MKQSLTGNGGLSRKLSAILVSVAMLVTGVAFAADNSIYIDQTGDNATIAVTQDGTTNVVRGIQGTGSSNSTPAKIYGDGNQVTVNQVGAGNTLNLGVVRGSGTGTAGNTVNYSVTGNNAIGTLNLNNDGQGTASNNTVGITQNGNGAKANLNLVGDGNSITVTTDGGANNEYKAGVTGNNNTQNVSVTGGGNKVGITQEGDGHTTSIASVGATNSYTVTQTGGSSGHTTALDFNGSSNTATVTQVGTAADNIANIKSVGSGNAFTINQNAR
jgi:hypothetical protein